MGLQIEVQFPSIALRVTQCYMEKTPANLAQTVQLRPVGEQVHLFSILGVSYREDKCLRYTPHNARLSCKETHQDISRSELPPTPGIRTSTVRLFASTSTNDPTSPPTNSGSLVQKQRGQAPSKLAVSSQKGSFPVSVQKRRQTATGGGKLT